MKIKKEAMMWKRGLFLYILLVYIGFSLMTCILSLKIGENGMEMRPPMWNWPVVIIRLICACPD